MRHVDEGRLHAWLDGELPVAGPDGARELELHLAACPVCRARAEEERTIRDDASAILRGADPGVAAAPTETARPTIDEVAVRRRHGGRRWVAVGWAASVLLALGIGWMARPAQRESVAIDAPARTPVPPSLPARTQAIEPAAVADAPTAVYGSVPAEATTAAVAAPAAEAPRAPSVPLARIAPGVETRVDAVAPVTPPPAVAAPPAPPPPTPAQEPPAFPVARGRVLTARAASAPHTESPSGPVTLRGRVTDTEGRPVSGAQVSVPGTPRRTVTAGDGSYTLVIPEERVAAGDSVKVRVDRIGMSAQVRALAPAEGASSGVDFALSHATLALEGLVATSAADAAPADAVAWREVEPAEAERRLGRRPVAVPQLPLLGVDVGRMEGRAAVRVRQQMEDGSVLSLVQRRVPGARSRQAQALSRAVEERGGWRIVLEEEGLVVDASAPVVADSLRRLPRAGRQP